MSTFFTSDTHFGDERILHLSQRPFACVAEMDEVMIEHWNDLVGPEDTVFHLGDFGDYRVRKHLNGKIKLLFGNYEREDLAKGRVTSEQLMTSFETVFMGGVYYYHAGGNAYWALAHEPSHRSNINFNLFGHIHATQMVKRNGLNVGVDCHHFRPISEETVRFYKAAIEKHYDEEVFGQ